jgi:hypothetical protein
LLSWWTGAFAALADAVADVLGDRDAGILLIDLSPANDARLHDVGQRGDLRALRALLAALAPDAPRQAVGP